MSRMYLAYGLRIQSELPLPELVPVGANEGHAEAQVYTGSCDVAVSLGPIAATLPGSQNTRPPWQTAPGRHLLSVDGVARYLITEGREITIDIAPGAAEESIRFFFLGAVCGVLLHLRRVIPLHASSIMTSRGALVFMGRSGTGKSTLLSTLLARGHVMMADDVTAVSSIDGAPALAYPGYPRVRLWGSVIRSMGLRPEGLRRVQPTSDKYLLPAKRFATRPAPVAALFELVETTEPPLRFENVAPAEQIARCSNYVRRARLFPGHEERRRRFDALAGLLRTAPLTRVLRPRDHCQPEALADFVEMLGA